MALEKIDSLLLVDRVEAVIKKHIIDSGLKPGDPLPREIDFAEKLGVSRSMIREATSRLRMLGILESRKGRGLVIREPDILNGVEPILELQLLGPKASKELMEFRLVIDLGLTLLVMERKTEEDLEYLEKVVQKEEADPENVEVSREVDIDFHSRLYAIAGNDILHRFRGLLNTFFSPESMLPFWPDRFNNKELVTHRDLLECMRGDDSVRFHGLMEVHLGHYLKKPTGNYSGQ